MKTFHSIVAEIMAYIPWTIDKEELCKFVLIELNIYLEEQNETWIEKL